MKARIVEFIIRDHLGWHGWDYDGKTENVPDLGKVTVVEVEDDTYNGYEGYQDAKIVFKVEFLDGSVRHFQKNGECSSYSTNWDGSFYEVKGTPKTVLVYERISG